MPWHFLEAVPPLENSHWWLGLGCLSSAMRACLPLVQPSSFLGQASERQAGFFAPHASLPYDLF